MEEHGGRTNNLAVAPDASPATTRRAGPDKVMITALIVAALVLGALIPMPAAVETDLLGIDRYELATVQPISEHVVVISVDGLRPDAIERFGATSMLRLMREGRYASQAQTVLPSNTIPGHTSMVTGVEPSVHGVTWNDRASVLSAVLLLSDRRRQVPSMFDFARAAGYSTAAVMAKSQMRQLAATDALEHREAPFLPVAHIKREWSVARVVAEVERYLIADGGRPNLLFVHLAEPDLTGHDHGWMGDEYGAAVRATDLALARILAAADMAFGTDGYTIILTSDHGGVDYGHGGSDPRELAIPWITAGRGVEQGGAMDVPVRITDTAATALWLLGVPVPAAWSGRPVESAYLVSRVATTVPERSSAIATPEPPPRAGQCWPVIPSRRARFLPIVTPIGTVGSQSAL